MGSNGKKKTTMQKLNRENRLRERRMEKEARKDARKQALAEGVDLSTMRGPVPEDQYVAADPPSSSLTGAAVTPQN